MNKRSPGMNKRTVGKAPPVDSTDTAIELMTAAFMRPQKLSQPYAWIGHIPFAFWIIEKHQPRVLVELGTHSGNSYLAFCQAVASFDLPTRCFAVDTWKGDEHAGFYDEKVFETLSYYHDQHYSTFSRLVRSTFDEALAHFSDHSIDLLHIDGLHSYNAVAHDYNSWIGKVSDRGVILMHDTNVRENEFGVFRFWEEVRSQFPHFEFLHCHGLGVLGVGPKIGPQMKQLFATGLRNDSCYRVRAAFAQLGHALTLQASLEDEKNQHQRALSDWKELQVHYDSMSEQARTLQASLADERKLHQESMSGWKELQAHCDLMSEQARALQASLEDEKTRHQENISGWKELQTHSDLMTEQVHALQASLSDEKTRHQENISGWKELQVHCDLMTEQVRTLQASLSNERKRHQESVSGWKELEVHYNFMSEQAHALQASLADERSRYQESMSGWKELQVHYDLMSEQARSLQASLADERKLHQESVSGWKELQAHYDSQLDQKEKANFEVIEKGKLQQAELLRASKEMKLLQTKLLEQEQTYSHHIKQAELQQAAQLIRIAELERRTLRTGLSVRNRVKIRLAAMIRWTWRQAGIGGWRRGAFRSASQILKLLAPKLHRRFRRTVSDPTILFDRDWYLTEHPEIAAAGIDPFTHYIHVGAAQGYDPNPLFDTDWYLAQNPDIAARGINPLIHFFHDGAAEGRDPNPLFDTDWYLAQNPDVAAAGINPLVHYLRTGAESGRDPSPEFDAKWYLANYPDVHAAQANPLTHYLLHGAEEGRSPRKIDDAPQNSEFFRLGTRSRLGHLATGREEDSSLIRDSRSVNIDAVLPSDARRAALPVDYRVDVIVPLYRGVAESRRCIESVLGSRQLNHAFGTLILVDDDSPEPALRSYLSDIANQDGILLLTNTTNMGFVASINRGIVAAGGNDVILLNSDTEVSGNWLDRLALQSHADPKIATVTPFSNNATICTYPDIGGSPDLPAGLSLHDIDRACMEANAGRAVDLPTGVGFCMFVRRTCLEELGSFDEAAFGKGYGEETDFCQRAVRHGWRHVLAADVFVFHIGEVSFAGSSNEKKANAGAVMRQRHPTYEAQVRRWVENDPAMPPRIAATAALWRLNGRPVILHVLHAAGGGTEKYVAELIGKLAEAALHLVLIAKKDDRGLSFSLLISDASDWRVVEFTATRMADVAPFLRSFGVTQVHVHHFLDIAEQVSSFLKHLGVPYDLSIHDYTAICPRIYLTRNELSYCGEPDEKGCLHCLSEGGYKLSTDILWWRYLGKLLIGDANRVLCPSVDVAERIRRYVPNARIIVVPHEEQFYRPEGALHPRPLLAEEPLRVAMLGIMAGHKGGTYLLDCIEAARQRNCRITWHVIGEFIPSMKTRAEAFDDVLSVTGRYEVTELPQLIEKIGPHLIFFPQRCPETYSYTLSEVFAAGIPLLAPEIGSFTERTAGVSWCWTYPFDMAPNKLIDKLIGMRDQLARGEQSTTSIAHPARSMSIPFEADFYREQYLRKSA